MATDVLVRTEPHFVLAVFLFFYGKTLEVKTPGAGSKEFLSPASSRHSAVLFFNHYKAMVSSPLGSITVFRS